MISHRAIRVNHPALKLEKAVRHSPKVRFEAQTSRQEGRPQARAASVNSRKACGTRLRAQASSPSVASKTSACGIAANRKTAVFGRLELPNPPIIRIRKTAEIPNTKLAPIHGKTFR